VTRPGKWVADSAVSLTNLQSEYSHKMKSVCGDCSGIEANTHQTDNQMNQLVL